MIHSKNKIIGVFMKLSYTLISTGILLFSTYTFADFSDEYITCVKSAGNRTEQMKECQLDEFKIQNKLAKKYYKKLLSAVESPQQEFLKNDQQKWLTQRNRMCKMKDEKIKNLSAIHMSCAVHITASRAEALEVQLRNKNLL